MSPFFGVILLVVWLLAVTGLGIAAIVQCLDGSALLGSVFGAIAIILFAAGVAVGTQSDVSDARLCLSGHQAWQQHTSHALVGKMIIPHASTRKAWVCDKWEAE